MANQPKKYKKFVATAATATLVASAIVPVASAASLSDIAGNTHEEAINALVDAKVISGYPDGTFKPNKTLTRSDVVKLLGKYLVSQGHSIPTDAVSNPRFSDLTSKSNKELLEYAAVVADAGVFAGSNGKLLAGDQITRENMAIVLVRMINTLKDVSLEEFVASQNFNGDVKDLNVAKAEARTAIQVLDFYDITNPSVANFNPKGNTTRGQFATFLHKTINSDFAGAAATTGTVKAINNTTVEVTFGEEVADIKALDFKIEGLEVSNAVVKQTDKKTVVLTTAAQKAGTEYTVTVNGNAVGKFTGVSAVIPTAIKVVERSQQGVLGQQVTVKAEVTVAEGQSKAGIPVTFNVTSGTNTSLNTPEVFEANTDANGVATFTYTRYANTTDDVVAYATGDRTKFQAGKVYWAAAKQLTIKEKAEGTVLSNGSKKVFEIDAPSKAGKYVFVTFENNVGVTTDKLTRSVFVEGTGLWEQQNNSIGVIGAGSSQYPYEITNGANRVVPVLLDSKGKANLVVSGTNGKVTPVVYEGVLKTSGLSNNPGSVVGDFANILYNPTALQAKAAEVSFEIKHSLGLTVEAKGVSNAAVAIRGTVQTGGRDYTATYVDKDGKPAKAGDIVHVAIQNNSTTSTNAFLVDEDGNELAHTFNDGYKHYALQVKGTEGKVNFTVASYHEEAFAAPIVYVNNGTGPDAHKTTLDASDLQAQAESVYFTKTIQYTAELVALDKNGKETKSVRAGGDEFVEYSYNLLDQNGKPRAYSAAATNVTFNFTAGTNSIVAGGKTITSGNPGSVTGSIAPGALSTKVKVTSTEAGSVTGYATASHVGAAALPSTDAVTVAFTSVSTLVTRGTLDATISATGTQISIDGVPYSLTGATYLNNGTVVPTLQAFRAHLVAGVTVDVTKDADGNLVFNVLQGAGSINPTSPTEILTAVNNATSETEVKTALANVSQYKALTAAGKEAVSADVWNTINTGGTFANYNALVSDVVTASNIDPTAVAYSAANTGSAATQATITGSTNSTLKIDSNSNLADTNYNGVEIDLVDTDSNNTTTTATFTPASGGSAAKVTVELAGKTVDGVYEVTSKLSDVKAAIEGLTGVNLKVSATDNDLTKLAAVETLTLAGGVDAVPASKATITLTYTSAPAVQVGDAVSFIIDTAGTEATVSGTVKSVNATTIVIEFTTDPAVASGATLKSIKGVTTVDFDVVSGSVTF
ncbi:S-layer homology domain-containing protein [Solibacillus sp. FSL K6-1126]|uniref:S-layer homology domain-containing protein n=1 Tax=Solibacillus sp. FSL K6-1126 TaxID=2921463 RepID=UPI0030F6AEDB